MHEKNHKKIQPLSRSFGLHVYYRVKNILNYRTIVCVFNFTKHFLDFIYITKSISTISPFDSWLNSQQFLLKEIWP